MLFLMVWSPIDSVRSVKLEVLIASVLSEGMSNHVDQAEFQQLQQVQKQQPEELASRRGRLRLNSWNVLHL